MKKIISLVFAINCLFVCAQPGRPRITGNNLTTSEGLKINSRRGTLIEKQIFNVGKFKDLNIQKIVLKDTQDNSTENLLGIMTEYETFDQISKKTLTMEKAELSKINQSLENLYQKENEKLAVETKYKFLTMNNIEFGAIYNEDKKTWTNYIKFPSAFYGNNLINYSREELKDLIKLLKNAEEKL